MPKRIQRKRTKGWRMPENAVYVGRPSKWGNPFTGPDAVEKYKWAISRRLWEVGLTWFGAGGNIVVLKALIDHDPIILDELRGKDLACWCPLDKPCHADILLEIVNEVQE